MISDALELSGRPQHGDGVGWMRGSGAHGGFWLSLAVATEAEADKAFAALEAGGQVMMPPAKTFWSPSFGVVTDKFGVGWMVSVVPPA